MTEVHVTLKSMLYQESLKVLYLVPAYSFFYINDIPDNITSTVRLFVDDTIMYIALKPKINAAALHFDKWTNKMENELQS